MQSSACTYACAHMHHRHGGFVHLNIHAETFVPLPNYSAISKGLSNMSMCQIWELEAGYEVRAASFKMKTKNPQQTLLPPVCQVSQKHDWQYQLRAPAVMLPLLWMLRVLGQNCLYMIIISLGLRYFWTGKLGVRKVICAHHSHVTLILGSVTFGALTTGAFSAITGLHEHSFLLVITLFFSKKDCLSSLS